MAGEETKETNMTALFDVRNFFKRWPRFYYFVGTVFGPMMYSGLSAKKFLERYERKGVTLNIGSGPRIINDEVVNVDIYPYVGVKILSDGNTIPLQNESVARIISDTVLEHVPLPVDAVKEMHRLLELGGMAYVTVPFLYPYHSSPSDYQRWTRNGIEQLFCDFEIVKIGVRAGPFSALTVYLNHLFAVLFSFGSVRLETLLVNMVMFITFPIKLLDIISHWPHGEEVASVLYCVVRKKQPASIKSYFPS
jgi:SAM-dependent methyltransferase